MARQAIEAAVEAGSRSVESNAHNTLGTGLTATGHEAVGLAEFEKAGALAYGNTKTALRYSINYSDGLYLAGKYEEALNQALAGIEVARDLGLQRSIGAMLAGNAAEPLIALGEWDRAAAMIDRALDLDPPAHHHAHLRLLRAWLNVWRGDLEEADAMLLEFRPMITDVQPSPQYVSYAIRADAEYALAAGDHQRAWSDVSVFFDHWHVYHSSHTYPVLAAGAAAARILDQRDGSGARSARVREFLQRAQPINIRRFWLPVIEAELADSTDGWRTGVESSAPAVRSGPPASVRGPAAGSAPGGEPRPRRGQDGVGDGVRRGAESRGGIADRAARGVESAGRPRRGFECGGEPDQRSDSA